MAFPLESTLNEMLVQVLAALLGSGSHMNMISSENVKLVGLSKHIN